MTVGEAARAWALHSTAWRDPAQVVGHWDGAGDVDSALLRSRVRGAFWDALAAVDATLLVSREYEHLLLALSARDGKPHITHLELPHPTGIAVDRERGSVRVASTRNPNQVYELVPATALLDRRDVDDVDLDDRPLLPSRSTFFPGSLYIHDLAFVGRRLYANAVAHNAVAELRDDGAWRRVWWPKAAEHDGEPDFGLNYLQLNSIAAGSTLRRSFFSASTDELGTRRPGHRNFAVDGRGVVFSGATREPVLRGLTRPHSARLHDDRLWVANSGYGTVVVGDEGRPEVVARLPGWTRGLCLVGRYAFVGTSRVIPRFRAYAPGLDVDRSMCGIHALDLKTGNLLGSLIWPSGNQIFAVDWLPRRMSLGLPFGGRRRRGATTLRNLFYAYDNRTTWETTR